MTITASWDKEGRVTGLTYRLDSEAVTSVQHAKSLEVEFGYLGAAVEHVETAGAGTATVLEQQIDLTQNEDLRLQYEDLINQSFPGGKDGTLDGNNVNFTSNASAADLDALAQAASHGATRTLQYDVQQDSTQESASVTFLGITLASASWTSTTDDRNLTSSSLEVMDVNGNVQTLKPAPKCYLPPFEKPEDYYASGWSNSTTSRHPYRQGYDLSYTHTPLG